MVCIIWRKERMEEKESGGRVVGARELSELYRELQLLRLKYDQLIEICRKLSKPWPNRGSDGKLLKSSQNNEARKNEKVTKVDAATAAAKNVFPPENHTDSPELKLLDSILKEARRIKITDEGPEETHEKVAKKRLTTERPAKTAERLSKASVREPHGDRKRLPKSVKFSQRQISTQRNQTFSRKVKHSSSATSTTVNSTSYKLSNGEATTPPLVTIVRHTTSGDVERRGRRGQRRDSEQRPSLPGPRGLGTVSLPPPTTPHISSSIIPSPSSREEEDDGEDEEQKFHLSRDGMRLRMPSKYTSLRNKIFKYREQPLSQDTAINSSSSTMATREHFVNRLLPSSSSSSSDSGPSTRSSIELELARQEYQLLTKEAKSLLVVSNSGVRDRIGAREKLESIVSRASAVEERVTVMNELDNKKGTVTPIQPAQSHTASSSFSTRPPHTRDDCPPPPPLLHHLTSCDADKQQGPLLVEDVRPLMYTSLSELLELLEVEHRLRMIRIQSQLLQFTTQMILPKYHLSKEELSTTSIQILSELAGKPKPIFILND